MNPHVICYDGPGLLSRHFYGAGKNTEAVARNVIDVMLALRDKHKAQVAIVAWDSDRSQRREQMPGYKGNRGPRPTAYTALARDFHIACNEADLRVVQCEGWEADDVLASVARSAFPLPSLLVSDDKDVLQCLSVPRCKVAIPRLQYEVWDEFVFWREWHILPEQLPEYLALRGDPVDAIPGLPGIGDTAASWLLGRFANATAAFLQLAIDDEHPYERVIPVKIANALRGGQAKVLAYRNLTTLNSALEIPGASKDGVPC